MHPRTFLSPMRLLPLGSAALLGGAFAFQHLGGLQPCVLCLYQRWPHAIVIGVGAIILLFALHRVPTLSRALLGIMALSLLVGAGIAMFHVGVEYKWWAGTPGCGAVSSGSRDLSSFTDSLLAAPVVRCDEVAWSLFGISMAGWNGLVSIALALFGLYASLTGRFWRIRS